MLESRHPCTPAMGTIETRFRVQLSKRSHSSISPLHSPNKRSPIPKRQRRMRTGTEKAARATLQSIPTTTPRKECAHQTNVVKPKPTIKDFQLSDRENKAITDLKLMSTQYVLLKVAGNEQNETILDHQSYFNLSNNLSKPECSNIIYFKVLDQKCDDKETLLNVISALYEEFIEQKQKKWILLEGDQATYERLQSIKAQYGNDLAWMVPFPGDWHFLKNFQEVLLKIYFDAGLSDLAKASQYLSNSIGTNFKRTHRFLLESWESLFRHFLSLFLSHKAPPDFISYVAQNIKTFPSSKNQTETHQNLHQLLEDLSEKYNNLQQDFSQYMEEQAAVNKTWRFWKQFVFKDCCFTLLSHM